MIEYHSSTKKRTLTMSALLATTMLLLAVGFFTTPMGAIRSAEAHKDPATGSTNGVSISIGVFYDAAATQPVIELTEADVGTTVYARSIAGPGTQSTDHNWQLDAAGSFTITDPSLTVQNVQPVGEFCVTAGTASTDPADNECQVSERVSSVTSDVAPYVVDLADRDPLTGTWVFIASVSGKSHSNAGDTLPVTASAQYDLFYASTILTKSADAEKVLPGTLVTYTYNETNDGSSPLANATSIIGGNGFVEDDSCLPVVYVSGDTNTNGILDPEESFIFECSMVINANTTNVATGHGLGLNDTDITYPDDPQEQATTTVVVISPDISLEKTVDEDKVLEGTEVTYTYNATNTGDVTLNNVVITDDQLGHIAGPVSLAPNESLVVSNVTTISGNTTNIATVIGFHQLGNVTAQDTVTIRGIDASIALSKTVDQDKVINGTEVTYTYNATNTGTVTLDNVVITDDLLGQVAGPVSLAPGESLVDTASTTIIANTTNTADVIGFFQLGNVTAQDTAFVRVINPSIDVEKSCSPETQAEPGEITWTIVVTNTGDVELVNVNVTDSEHGVVASGLTLAPGQNYTTVIVDSNLAAGNYTNTASAIGAHQLGTVEDSDEATCEVEVAGFEGCTPGFWKTHTTTAVWGPTGYSPTDKFSAVFGETITVKVGKSNVNDPTLIQALNAEGGGINALARHAVAALLNAAHSEIDYPISESDVISSVAAAISSGNKQTIEALKNELDTANNLGCGIDAHGRPIEPETT